MQTIRSISILALVAGALLVAAPAHAWTCKAKNARGAVYTGAAVLKSTARARTLAKCRADTVVPATCHIVNCSLP